MDNLFLVSEDWLVFLSHFPCLSFCQETDAKATEMFLSGFVTNLFFS